jgi:hypothetical protein
MVCRQSAWSLLAVLVCFVPAVSKAQSELRVLNDQPTARSQTPQVVEADFEATDTASHVAPCGGYACQKGANCHSGCGCGAGGCGYGHAGHGYGYPYGCGYGPPLVDRNGKYYPHGWFPHGYLPYGYGPGYPVSASAGRMYEGYNADLFYNYYVPQGSGEGVTADMYPCPHYTPWPAIQVYYTYQPWLPHEFLYNHHRSYVRYYSGGMGRNVTHVSWGGSPIRRVHEQGLVW